MPRLSTPRKIATKTMASLKGDGLDRSLPSPPSLLFYSVGKTQGKARTLAAQVNFGITRGLILVFTSCSEWRNISLRSRARPLSLPGCGVFRELSTSHGGTLIQTANLESSRYAR